MATHQVVVNPLDPVSVALAVQQIQQIAKEFERKLEIFYDRLAELGRTTAQGIFNGATTVTVVKTDKGRKIVAAGCNEAYFVEFGTGVYAGATGGLYAEFNEEIKPGSYSESVMGAHTWSAWIAADKDPNDYPYNTVAQSPMYKAYEAICQNADSIARSVFG